MGVYISWRINVSVVTEDIALSETAISVNVLVNMDLLIALNIAYLFSRERKIEAS